MIELTICDVPLGTGLMTFRAASMASMLDVSRASGIVRNHFLNGLDHPGHQFVAVFFGRPQVDVDIVHALFPLEKGFFLDRLGVALLERAADLLEMTFKLSPISNIDPPSLLTLFSGLGSTGASRQAARGCCNRQRLNI
jgi:hypothetical protein